MDLATLQTLIQEIGEDKIAGFLFDNSARKLFKTEDNFKLADFISQDGEYIKFVEKDPQGNVYYVYKPIETIQSVIAVEDAAILDKLNHRYIGG